MTTESKNMTSTQIGLVLNDIAACSQAIGRCIVMVTHSEDERDIEAIYKCIESLSERIGVLSDRAAEGCHESSAVFSTTVEDWMMPPSYRSMGPKLGDIR